MGNVNKTVTDICSVAIQEKVNEVSQSSRQLQIIENVSFDPPPPGTCKGNANPKNLLITQNVEGSSEVASAVQGIKADELSNKIIQELVKAAQAKSSTFQIGNETLNRIRSAIMDRQKRVLQNHIEQIQVQRSIRVTLTCGNVVMNQQALVRMIASELANEAMKVIRSTDEYNSNFKILGIIDSQIDVNDKEDTSGKNEILGFSMGLTIGGWAVLVLGIVLLIFLLVFLILHLFPSEKKKNST